MIDRMVRAVAATSFLILLTQGLPAGAQDAPGERDEARYSFNKVDDGYLRLDGRTGQVSLCTRRPAGWASQAVADDRTALEAEIARLQGENATLIRHSFGWLGGERHDVTCERMGREAESPPPPRARRGGGRAARRHCLPARARAAR